MILKQDYREVQKSNLEGLSLFELFERVANEVFNHRKKLSASSSEGREYLEEEYMQKTRPLREEVIRREQLYLEYYRTFIKR